MCHYFNEKRLTECISHEKEVSKRLTDNERANKLHVWCIFSVRQNISCRLCAYLSTGCFKNSVSGISIVQWQH